MIDGHVHNAGRGDSVEMKTIIMVQSAVRDLEAGFTTTVDMDSRGGFGTVELEKRDQRGRDQGTQDAGLRAVAEPEGELSLPEPRPRLLFGLHGGQEHQRSLARARRGTRVEAAWCRLDQDLHDAGFRRAKTCTSSKPTAPSSPHPSLTLEEVQAIVDEAHRMGLKVACHTYGGDGMRSCINAGVDLSMHVTELYKDDALLNTRGAEEAAHHDDDRRSGGPQRRRQAGCSRISGSLATRR